MYEDNAREQWASYSRVFTTYGLIDMLGHSSVHLPESRRLVTRPGRAPRKVRGFPRPVTS